jgi:hypothetical protein
MAVSFLRQLGRQPGTQLNPLKDDTELQGIDNSDQNFGIIMRATRGRIDKPFALDRGNVIQKIGKGERINGTSAGLLNEAYIHVYEAVNKGAAQAIIQRIVTSAAVIKTLVVYQGSGAVIGTPTVASGGLSTVPVTTGGTGYGVAPDVVVSGGNGTGASATALINASGAITGFTIVPGTGYTVAPTVTIVDAPKYSVVTQSQFDAITIPYLMAINHLECFNDGIQVEIRADELRSGGASVANSKITVVIKDPEGNALYSFYGSLVPGAVDEFGNSFFIDDVVSNSGYPVEITAGSLTSIPTTSAAYGYDSATGRQKWSKSGVKICFTEGGFAYTTQDYAAARQKLQFTPYNYGYISSGGTQSPALLAQLAQLAFDTNRQLRYDIPGNLAPSAAVTWNEQLNMGALESAELVSSYWSPLKCNDPAGINGKGFFGVATLNIAMRCGRNAQSNALGVPPKNFPVAGINGKISRSGIKPEYTTSPSEDDALARAKVNPCGWMDFEGGGAYVFKDQLTAALVESSARKLISVVEMATHIDGAVTRYGNNVIHLPMSVAINRMKDFLKSLFERSQASGWLVNSDALGGKAFAYEVVPNSQYPFERIDVSYWVRYDGAVRQIFVTHTLAKA